MQHANLVVIASYSSQLGAALAKSALESAEIDAMIQADTAGGLRDHLAWSGAGFKILVREEDADAARQVLTPPASDQSPSPDFQTGHDPQAT
jgi:hypothetical protein